MIQTKELMIGDLVKRPCCIDCVKEVRSNGIIGSDHLRGLITFKELTPIPLTEEILKMNGFDDVNLSNLHKCYFRQKDNEDGTELYNIEADFYSDTIDACFVDITCDSIGSVRLKCKYVHELQHALRLCGLNKLADNFKLE